MAVLQTIIPSAENLGPIEIRRVLPSSARQMVGPFIFMDQGGPATLPNGPNAGVGEHPHAGLSTFTYLLAGKGYHRDSAGHAASIQTGDIALMTAGSGITHEELPHPEDTSPVLDSYFVQMWLALPDEVEDMKPAFELHRADTLPIIEFGSGHARVLMGTAWGATAPTTCFIDTVFVDLDLRQGAPVPIEIDSDECALFVLEGDCDVSGSHLKRHTLSILDTGQSLTIKTSTHCRAVLFGGAAFPSRRYIGGSFVASSPEKIRDHKMRYIGGQFPAIAK
ncbi:MAG: pirin family protein [Pseudomonadota bacterium]